MGLPLSGAVGHLTCSQCRVRHCSRGAHHDIMATMQKLHRQPCPSQLQHRSHLRSAHPAPWHIRPDTRRQASNSQDVGRKPFTSQQAVQQTWINRRDLIKLISLASVSLASTSSALVALPAPVSAAGPGQLRDLTPAEEQAVSKALKANIPKAKAPVVLRLAYHDAGTYSKATEDGGCNASIQFELARPENFGLKRGWRVVEQVKESLKGTPAADLSFADLIALSGAYAVSLTSGPRIPVRVGRRDATGPDPEGRLPELTFSAQQQKDSFARMGFSAQEFMALMGSHTIGSKGFGAPDKFDNAYYATLLQKPWTNTKDEMASMIGLPSDHVLPDDAELLPYIQEYAADQDKFFRDFSAAYIKLMELTA